MLQADTPSPAPTDTEEAPALDAGQPDWGAVSQAPTLDSVFDALEHAVAVRNAADRTSVTASDTVVAAEQRLSSAVAADVQASASVSEAILAKNAAIDIVIAFLNGMRETV